MADCTRCGQCCTKAFVALYSVKVDEDNQELARWLRYHRLGTRRLHTDDAGDVLMIDIPIVCQHLSTDVHTGICSCDIYDNRPVICREHRCKKITG